MKLAEGRNDVYILAGTRQLVLVADVDHRAFIASTWSHIARDYAPENRCSRYIYRLGQKATCDMLLDHGGVTVLVPEQDHYTVNGWVAKCDGAVVMGYTPPELRRLGIFECLCLHGSDGVVLSQPPPFSKPDGWTFKWEE